MKKAVVLSIDIILNMSVKFILFSGAIGFLSKFGWSMPSQIFTFFLLSELLCLLPITLLKKRLRKKNVLACSLLSYVFDALIYFLVVGSVYMRQGFLFDQGVLLLSFFIILLGSICLWMSFFSKYYFNYEIYFEQDNSLM